MDIAAPKVPSYQLIYPSLAQCFVNSLAIAVHRLELAPGGDPIHIETIPAIGRYRSAIALALAPQDNATLAVDLGAIAQTYLDAIADHSSAQTAFEVIPQPTGWIEFQCSLDMQCQLMTHIAQQPSTISPQPLTDPRSGQLSPKLIFELQYAHARCCRMINLAQSLILPQDQGALGAIAPWLSDYFRLNKLADSIEPQLWQRLLTFPQDLQTQKKLWAHPSILASAQSDDLFRCMSSCLELPLSQKSIQILSQDWVILFQKFYSQCRLVDISPVENRNLLLLRLALFSGLKTVLHFMLTELIQVSAPQIL